MLNFSLLLLACALLVMAVVYGSKLANVAAVESLIGERPRRGSNR